ncbi:hypothetical protein PGTUg99_024738 [Puccinia graminis f. sp. tritici]|uniref:Uncharacterized protein n=1 Tax=Puccinia graminis f. sp. tritici TaxID=56615 RepID=A0A5B0Q466_PUCGR|nr:hypothetical protein PGTUg99_024738 [Puccinia graminis f. sp. tritici]
MRAPAHGLCIGRSAPLVGQRTYAEFGWRVPWQVSSSSCHYRRLLRFAVVKKTGTTVSSKQNPFLGKVWTRANQSESKSKIELLHSFLAAPRATSIIGIAATPFFHRRCPRWPSGHQGILVRFKNVILGIGIFASFRVPDS